MLRLSDLAKSVEMTPDMVSQFATLAFMQAHIVAAMIHEVVIPSLPPAKRTFAESIARRIERGAFLEEDALRDFETFLDLLERQIEGGTHLYWHGDENHVRGGYEAVYREREASNLASAATELALLGDIILATLSAARAVRETGSLIDS
ncbi:hypothetical protein [Loktanella sp. M215]|uniref:hypothetical protein n=1 Tax=Loktanella sp. M215 TaxID=2675431 RepID=UPI001F31D727|nr:hypothetical protein [Loktanella sp. M215]MCF7700713.1 hypothetical protein [Loktanella sp. M215]